MKDTQNEETQELSTLEEAQEKFQQEESQREKDEAQTQEKEDYETKYKELYEIYVRTHADFENTKKRLERDKYQALEYAYEKIAKDLLGIIDTLEKALESAKAVPSNEAITQGLQLTLDNLHKTLAKHGIECIDCDGGFDPNIHDAIMQVPAQDKENGEIVQVLQKGYKYKERTLRPAMVSVAKNN